MKSERIVGFTNTIYSFYIPKTPLGYSFLCYSIQSKHVPINFKLVLFQIHVFPIASYVELNVNNDMAFNTLGFKTHIISNRKPNGNNIHLPKY